MGGRTWGWAAVVAAIVGPGPVVAWGQTAPAGGGEVFTIADSLVGAVGGVAVDRGGTIYVADFGETVYKIQPDGRTDVLATGLYGASGNAVGPRGELYQASFNGNYVSRIDRDGTQSIVADGFSGPVGVAVEPDGGLLVNNCQANSISRVTPDGEVRPFAASDLLNCPNGIVRHPDGHLFVANFSDGNVLRVSPGGDVTLYATIPGGGNGHVAIARGLLYVTAFQSHRIYSVAPGGEVELVAGTGGLGEVDGAASQAQFSWPNGIAAGPNGDRLYVNDYLNRVPPGATRRPVPRSSLRMIKLPSIAQTMTQALATGGVDGMEEAYRQFKSNPATAGVYTEFELNALGYQLMGADQLEAATRVFELNVESYPGSWNVYDSLGEAHMNAGDAERAIELYEQSLEINPANQNATQMIDRIRSGG